VIFYMDGLGIRPVMGRMGQRLADGGYLVFQPRVYYRFGSYPPRVASEVLGNPKSMEEVMKWANSLDRDRKVSDSVLSSNSFHQGQTLNETIRRTGYCMGGDASLTTAGAFPDRFAALASFHGGNLGADKPDSPHQFVKNITGRVYVAAAIEDASFPEEQKIRLEKALTDARVNYVVETYPGARHGFAVPNLPVFDKGAAN
jgi:carboxymethylenebutenolidase